MGDDVEESFAFERVVGGSPVGDVFDAVLFKELHGVLAETAEKVVELAFKFDYRRLVGTHKLQIHMSNVPSLAS